MPLEEWYLKPGHDHNTFLRVQIDPATISGYRGTFGPALTIPYTVPEDTNEHLKAKLLSLEGWIGWSGEAPYFGKLRIPSQAHQPQPKLEIPLTDGQLEAIEQKRNGAAVLLTISLAGVAVFAPRTGQPTNAQALPVYVYPVPVHATATQVSIEREQWLRILQQLGAGARRLVELPEPRLPREYPGWKECLRLLEQATQFYRRGEYEQVQMACRQIVEGIPHVLCEVWGFPQKRDNQAYAGWLAEIKNRLIRAWPGDQNPDMLHTLLTGAWTWLAPAPHYNSGIPLREETAFALGLCTDLLHIAGQILKAHPDRLVAAP